MHTAQRLVAAITIGVFGVVTVLAQPPGPETSIEERLVAVERGIATLDTRLALRSTSGAGALGAGSADAALAARVERLERELTTLAVAVQRAERQAEAAARQANQALRQAADAERLAREIGNRLR